MITPLTLTRSEYELMPRRLLSKPSRWKPAVWRVETPEGPIVVKDARGHGVVHRLVARWLIGRERRVLERITSIDCVPRLLGQLDRDALVLSLVPGRTLDGNLFRARPRELVAQLSELINSLHALGVFHLDLHQRKNLLVDETGRLRVVDFGAAVALGPAARLLLGGVLTHSDRHAPYKYLARFAPEELTLAEARAVVWQRRLRRLWPFVRPGRVEQRAALKRQGR
jgi:serine/threonine protein kinase